jgi:hypothetical protein
VKGIQFMKKILLGAAAMLAVAAPGVAAADSGQVGVHVGGIDVDGSDSLDFYGIDGAYNHGFGNGWEIQADGQHDRVDLGGANTSTSYGAVAFGMRNSGHSLYGHIGTSDFFASSGIQYGVGGQMYFSSATVGLSVGHVDIDDLLIPSADLTSADLTGSWFFTPNLAATGELGWAEADIGGSDGDWYSYGIGALWRFTGSPFAVEGRYRHDEYDSGEVDAWLIGLTLNFGTTTAQEQSQQGPSWDGARRLYEDSALFLY